MDDSAPNRSDAAGRTSARLSALIRDEIDRAGGWIRFARFMELALYAPGLGYYSAGAAKIGRDPRDGSDFVTAPELTPLFARALARPVAEVLTAGGDTILELGGGTGRLAADLLAALESIGRLPARYLLLDVSADLRERQHATLTRVAPHLLDRVAWPSSLPETIDGVVLGNEVLDALPVDLVVRAGGAWLARGVTTVDDDFVFADRAPPDDLARHLADLPIEVGPLPDGYLTEVHAATCGLIASVVERMTPDAVAIFIDYGFPGSEYYHPQRMAGTLMAHAGHRASTHPLADVGLRDITAHVDFSAVAAAAATAGGRTIGYTSQAAFLVDCGITDLLVGSASDVALWAPQVSALNLLLSPAEMGEFFKVIALGRRSRSLTGFGPGDRAAAL